MSIFWITTLDVIIIRFRPRDYGFVAKYGNHKIRRNYHWLNKIIVG